MKKVLSMALVMLLALTMLVGCGGSPAPAATEAPAEGGDAPAEGGVIKVAALESAYEESYPGMWQEVCDAFTAQTGISVELTVERNLEDVIGAAMQGGEYPDFIHLAVGREAALTEQFIKDKNIAEITDVLSMTIPGEEGTVGDKIAGGFTETSITNPYGDGKTYLAPMFYSPCGLFYNAGLFEEKGWTVPTTWEEMWALGDKALEEGIYLFTYPTTGYFDTFIPTVMYSAGGADFFEAATHYEEGVWDTPEAQQLFDIIETFAKYTNPITPAQANDQDFTMNQQLILDNKALFIPNGTWLVGEMAEAPRAEGFKWGMCAVPAGEGSDPYSYCWFEQAWIPAGAENIDGAKQFMAFLYSDAACEIFAKGNGIQPVIGVADMLEGDNQIFYSVYDNGAKAAMGGFAAYNSVPGLGTVREVFFDPINSLVEGTLTKDEWVENIKAASDLMRENLVG